MSDVVRSERVIQEVVYSVSPDSTRKAVLALLNDYHNGSFTDETKVQFFPDGSAEVTTLFNTMGDAA